MGRWIMPNDLMVESFGAPGGADTHYGNQETVGCVDCGYSARTSLYATIEPMEMACRKCGAEGISLGFCIPCFSADCRCLRA